MATRKFDRSASLVMARFRTVLGHNLDAGTPLQVVDGADGSTAGELDPETAEALWNRGLVVDADAHRPTPVESPEDEALRTVTLEPLDGGWWMIRAPWLEGAEKVQGEDNARARYDEIVAAGRPAAAEPAAVVLPASDPIDSGVAKRSRAAIPTAEVADAETTAGGPASEQDESGVDSKED